MKKAGSYFGVISATGGTRYNMASPSVNIVSVG